MNIILIGSGNVASVLGRRLFSAGHRITHVWSRTPLHGLRLAKELGAVCLPEKWTEWPAAPDIILVSVTDDAYPALEARLPPTEKLLLHTGGAVPGDILRRLGARTGVFYPLQSIRSETERIPDLPMLIDAARDVDFPLVAELARSVSSQVSRAGDNERMRYHVAAVFAANFANHLFALTENFCLKEGIGFGMLRPLLEETVLRMRSGSPSQWQTGPAIRNDQGTIDKHLLLLKDHPEMQGIYQLLSKSIMDFYA